MERSVDVAIIGAGQAGLATSWYLTQANVDHVVLEAGRVAETWRTRRWDSFCLVTPNWTVKLPGATYDGPEPDGFMPLAELVHYFQSWSKSFHAPVEDNSRVTSVDRDGDEFLIALASGKLKARRVVVASGAYQRAHRPAGSEQLPKNLHQMLAEEYRNPGVLPPGAVLVVGSGQTGCQLAEEIRQSGRQVFLACGRCGWLPRRMEGRDTMWWALQSGFLDRTPDMLQSPAARLMCNPSWSGHDGGKDLHLRTLLRDGVELLGRFTGAAGGKLFFADDLAASADFGDARWADFRSFTDTYCTTTGTARPDYDIPPPLRIKTRAELDVLRDGLSTVIWTTGYRPEYGWVKLPVFDEMGFPVQVDGHASARGLYFVGVHWMRKFKSPILCGVGEDAEIVARQIVETRR
jgi:putative flavoprotein involved in K+ transport